MPVVSNTSPILNLAIIGRLDLLKRQFDVVLIPAQVRAELKLDTEFAGVAVMRQAMKDGWLREFELNDVDLYRVLSLELDAGESAAIALAIEQKTGMILLDESDGRSKAKAMGLRPVGVLGILLRAKRDGSLKSVKEAMESLRKDAGFFVDEHLYESVLKEADE